MGQGLTFRGAGWMHRAVEPLGGRAGRDPFAVGSLGCGGAWAACPPRPWLTGTRYPAPHRPMGTPMLPHGDPHCPTPPHGDPPHRPTGTPLPHPTGTPTLPHGDPHCPRPPHGDPHAAPLSSTPPHRDPHSAPHCPMGSPPLLHRVPISVGGVCVSLCPTGWGMESPPYPGGGVPVPQRVFPQPGGPPTSPCAPPPQVFFQHRAGTAAPPPRTPPQRQWGPLPQALLPPRVSADPQVCPPTAVSPSVPPGVPKSYPRLPGGGVCLCGAEPPMSPPNHLVVPLTCMSPSLTPVIVRPPPPAVSPHVPLPESTQGWRGDTHVFGAEPPMSPPRGPGGHISGAEPPLTPMCPPRHVGGTRLWG